MTYGQGATDEGGRLSRSTHCCPGSEHRPAHSQTALRETQTGEREEGREGRAEEVTRTGNDSQLTRHDRDEEVVPSAVLYIACEATAAAAAAAGTLQ